MKRLINFLSRFRFALIVLLALAAAPSRVLASPAAGYWWNPATPGTGFVIETQGTQIFMAGFLYDANGNATWLASVGPMSGNQYTGTVITFSGGQTLTGSFQLAQQSPVTGTITINFSGATSAELTWQYGGASANFPIQRFDIVPGGSSTPQPETNPQAGWWWNPAESGRGFAIEVQNGQMFIASYMYDNTGKPIWYSASGPMTDAALFQGEWSLLDNGPTLGGTYQAPGVANANVGAVTVQFASTNSATLTLPDGRQIPLTRFDFGASGPTLSTFSPAALAPAGVLTLTGSNFDPTANLALTLFDNTGYSVSVPLTSVTATGATAVVPPYFNVGTGAFGSGTVNLKVTQAAAGVSVDTNTLSGFTIQQLPAAKNAGQGTFALIQATLQQAQALQASTVGTVLDSPQLEAAIESEVQDIQQLVTNIQSVVQDGASFSLGAVGGVDITVNASNISDVDNLILATLQSLAAQTTGSAATVTEKTAEASGPGCMSAEASAFAQAMLSGNGNLDTLALNLLKATGASPACNTLGSFTPAYQIFGGAGGIGLGIADRANTPALPPAKLPGAALFGTLGNHAGLPVGLNALLSPAFGNLTPNLQFAIGNLTALDLPLDNEVIAKSSGPLAANLGDALKVSTLVAPPVPALGDIVPINLPSGYYSLNYSFTFSINGRPVQGSVGPLALINSDGYAFAVAVQDTINTFDNSRGCNNVGTTCATTVLPFNGTTFQVVVNLSSAFVTGTITYVLTKTG
jgi:hypothetical protein